MSTNALDLAFPDQPQSSSGGQDPVDLAFSDNAPSWADAAHGAANVFKGGTESVLHSATGAVGALGGGLTYLGTLAASRDPDAAKAVQEATENALTYQPRTEEGKANVATLNKIGSYLPKAGEYVGSNISEGEQKLGIPSTIANMTAGTANAVITGAPWLLGLRASGGAPEVTGAASEPHPLAAAAEAETARLGQIKAAGEKAGLDLPEGGTPARHAQAAGTNQPLANSMTRQELQLPPQAPLIPPMLDKARAAYASPAYEAIKAVPRIDLDPAYHSQIEALDLDRIKDKYQPPTGDAMSGQQAVDLSKNLRFRANQYDRQASISGNPEASDLADTHRDAAQVIEDAVQRHLEKNGQGSLADDWDSARIYTAKTYSVQNALDGAGNVKVPALKQQLLKGRPLSGNLEVLGNLGAQYPKAFTPTLESAPKIGLGRELAAKGVEMAGTGAGALIGSGIPIPGASAAGAIIGGTAAGKLSDYIRGGR